MNCKPNWNAQCALISREKDGGRQSCWMNDWRTKVCQNNILLNLIIAMKIGQWQQLIVCLATWMPSKTYTSTHEINPRTRINVKLTLPNGKFFSVPLNDRTAIFCVVNDICPTMYIVQLYRKVPWYLFNLKVGSGNDWAPPEKLQRKCFSKW